MEAPPALAHVVPQGYVVRCFVIRTPPNASHLSTAKCLAWCVSAVEDDASIYGTLMRPLVIMVDKWKSFSDNMEQGVRVFTDRDGPMEEEKGTTVYSRYQSRREKGQGHRYGKREWGGGGRGGGRVKI